MDMCGVGQSCLVLSAGALCKAITSVPTMPSVVRGIVLRPEL